MADETAPALIFSHGGRIAEAWTQRPLIIKETPSEHDPQAEDGWQAL